MHRLVLLAAYLSFLLTILGFSSGCMILGGNAWEKAVNPIAHADVPDWFEPIPPHEKGRQRTLLIRTFAGVEGARSGNSVIIRFSDDNRTYYRSISKKELEEVKTEVLRKFSERDLGQDTAEQNSVLAATRLWAVQQLEVWVVKKLQTVGNRSSPEEIREAGELTPVLSKDAAAKYRELYGPAAEPTLREE